MSPPILQHMVDDAVDTDDDVENEGSGSGGDWIKMSQTGPVIFPGLPPTGGVWPPPPDMNNLPSLQPGNIEPKAETRRGRGRPRKFPPPVKGPFPRTTGTVAVDTGDGSTALDENKLIVRKTSRRSRGPGSAKGGSYVCDLCGKPFATWAGRYFHMAKHTGQYKLKCDLCDKGFMKTDAYKNHMMMHRKQIKKGSSMYLTR